MTDTTQYSLDEGLIELAGSPPMSIWVQTCPNTRCDCRSALVLGARRGRDELSSRPSGPGLLAAAAIVRAAWDDARCFSDVASQLADVDAFEIDIDSARVDPPADGCALDEARVAAVVERMDGETLDAIARLWIRGKGWPDPEQRLRDAKEIVVRGWRPGQLVACEDVLPLRRDMYELDDRLFEATDLHCPVPSCDCGEVMIDFTTTVPRGGPRAGAVVVERGKAPRLEPGKRDRACLERLWADYVDRHPRYRDRFAARGAAIKSIGDRIVRDRSASAGPRISRNAPCPCGSGRKYKKCCESASPVR